jgi:hypothetical protein
MVVLLILDFLTLYFYLSRISTYLQHRYWKKSYNSDYPAGRSTFDHPGPNKPTIYIASIAGRLKMRGTYENKKISGRPTKITKHEGHNLAYGAKQVRWQPLEELRNEISL